MAVTPRSPGTAKASTIGAVLRALHEEFPDVSVSKIRFLEAEGLITPARTASGYRTYSEQDVDRLRFILTAQRDRFWPLKVIREALDAMDRGLAPPDGGDSAHRPRVPQPAPDPHLPTAADLAAPATLRLTRDELQEAAGLDRATFQALGAFGLVHADDAGHYDDNALAVARAVAALTDYGVEPRHLRPFRTAADREIGLVQQIVTTARAAGARHHAQDPTPSILAACIALHTALVKSGLAR